MIKIFFSYLRIWAMLLLVVSLSLCWTMSTRAKNSRSHGYLYDMLSMIFWFVWGEDTGVVTRLDIYHLAGAGAGSWWYWHCDCDQDQDQEDHYYWDFVNTSSSSEIAPQMTPAGPIRYNQHHTWPVLTIHGYRLYACFLSILPTGSFKRLGVFKFRLRAVKMHQIKFSTCAFFSPFRDIL